MKKQSTLDTEVPAKCRRMVRMMMAIHGYHVSHEAHDALHGAIAMRRAGTHNSLIYIKKAEPFAGVALLPKR
jgi:hypothetical protein